MSWLTPALASSRLLGPFSAIAWLSVSTIGSWLDQSILKSLTFGYRSLLKRAEGFGLAEKSWAHSLYVTGLIVGTIGLFASFTILDTGPIGALTYLLFVYALLGSVLLAKPLTTRLTIVDGLVVLFVASAAISTAFSSFTSSVIGLAKLTTFFTGYWLFRAVLSQTHPLWKGQALILLLGSLVVLGLMQSAIGFYQYVNHIQPLATWVDPSVNPELKMTRIFGTLKPSNPNLLAGFLIFPLASALGLGLVALHRRCWKYWVGGLACFATAAVLLIAIVLTGSRGGYLAILGMLGLLFAYGGHLIWHDAVLKSIRLLKGLWIGALIGLAGLSGLAVAASPVLQHRIASIFAMREDSSISYRLNVYNSVMQMIRDNWLFGIGPGNGTFKQVYGYYMVPGYFALGSYSVPLEITAEQGIVGLLVFLLLALVLALRTLRTMDGDSSLRNKWLVALLACGVLGSLLYGVFDTIWYRPSVNLVFWFFVAALSMQTEPEFVASEESAEGTYARS